MAQVFDVVVVGGGTAGAIVAARLSEDPSLSVCLLEAGPSDLGRDEVLRLRRWLELLESDYDYGYTTTLQPRGNAHIVHSRARVLGGCSSHNTQIWFKPLPLDWKDWVDQGATGWDYERMDAYHDRIPGPHGIVAEQDRNPFLLDWIEAASAGAGVPANPDWNAAPFSDGVGFLDVGYDPATGIRSSSSVMYLHPIMGDRDNLSIQCESRALRLEVRSGRATGVHVVREGGVHDLIEARREIVVACGSVDTPRLLLLSGIGPRRDLERLGIEAVHDLPGVGENLIDHPESIIIWKLKKPMGPEGVMDADCALFVNRLQARRAARPDVPHVPAAVHLQHRAARLRGAGRPLVHLHDAERPALAGARPAVAPVEGPEHQAGDGLPLLPGRGRLRRADDRRRAADRPQGRRDVAVQGVDRLRDRTRRGRSRPTRSCRRTAAPCTTRSTTRRAPARWAPRTTTWRWSTRRSRCAASRASPSPTARSSRR